MVILTGPEHFFSFANEPYERMVGRATVGKTVREAFPNKEVDEFVVLLDRVYATGVPYVGKELPLMFCRPDGQVAKRYIDVGYYPLRHQNGTVNGITAIHFDVTEQVVLRKRAEKSDRRFRQIANTLPLLVWTADVKGHVDWYSQQWYTYTSLTPGAAWDEGDTVVHPDDMEGVVKRWRHSIATGEVYEIESRIRRGSDGQYRWMLSRAVPIFDGKGSISKWVGSSTDIHEQKELNRSLSEIQTELVCAKEKAIEASKVKSAFLANMSHEIRTPLNSINGFSRFLLENKLSDEERSQSLGTIVRNSVGLSVLVDDILDLSKVEAGKLEIQTSIFSTVDLISDMERMFSLMASNKKLALRFEIDEGVPRHMKTDAPRLRQILINLIGNAIKFTQSGSISIRVTAPPAPSTDVSFHVTDSGIGLTLDQQTRLFQPYSDGHARARQQFAGPSRRRFARQRLARRARASQAGNSGRCCDQRRGGR